MVRRYGQRELPDTKCRLELKAAPSNVQVKDKLLPVLVGEDGLFGTRSGHRYVDGGLLTDLISERCDDEIREEKLLAA